MFDVIPCPGSGHPTAVDPRNNRIGLSLNSRSLPPIRAHPHRQYELHFVNLSCRQSSHVSFSFGKIVVLFLEEHSRKKSLTPINKCFSLCCQIPTPSSLERILCSVLYETSEDEGDREGLPGDCHPRWSAAQTYLVHAVSWLHVYKQVLSSCRCVCPGCASLKCVKCVHFPPTSFTG